MDRYVFIDETGDLGETGSKYFIITAIWIDEPAPFDRLIKNMRRHKFHKELSKACEIKANNSSSELVKYILKKFSEMDSVHAQSIILEKKKIYSAYLKGNKDKLYNFVCGHLANIAIDSKRLILRIDKSKGKQSLVEDFNCYIERKFKEARWTRDLECYHSWSESWSGLQIADVVSWAVFQKYEWDNDYYLRIIEKKTNLVHVWQ
jgi:hypothetical protein